MLHELMTHYSGAKIKAVFAGAGNYILRSLEIPGASSFVDSFVVPYSNESKERYLKVHHPLVEGALNVLKHYPAVSPEVAITLHEALCASGGEALPVTISAALETTRERKGPNQAFIVFGHASDYETWHLSLSKASEAERSKASEIENKRFVQDQLISKTALSLAFEIPSVIRTELEDGGYLRRIR
tara:strand:- start:501 stop:1058 length:558 start_codon:yes stop_codon:yes gene_type:complete